MIDTVRLIYHNIKAYPLLCEYFIPDGDKKKVSNMALGVYPSEVGPIQAPSIYQFYSGTNKFLPIRAGKRVHVPSWDYSINLRLERADADQAFVAVDLSLPKFFWGTNVFQFVSFPEKNSEMLYTKLMRAIKQVTLFLFKGLDIVSTDDIEIARIDFCYNQFFHSRAEADEYQKAQWDHMAMVTKAMYAELKPGHGSNWVYANKRYSFKCYHKGDEFKKHDLLHLRQAFGYNSLFEKFGGRYGKKSYNLTDLQNEADRILRYEITYRREMIHYLTQYNTFAKIADNQPAWIRQSKLYDYLHRIDKRKSFAQLVNQFGETVPEGSAIEYFCNHVKRYTVTSVFDRPYNALSLALSPFASFSYTTFRLLFDHFWKKVAEAQIDSRSNFSENLIKVKRYQKLLDDRKKAGMTRKGTPAKKGKKAGSVHTYRLVSLALLSTVIDLRELKAHLPKNTYERLITDANKSGIPMRTQDKQLVKPVLDYTDYQAGIGRLINHTI